MLIGFGNFGFFWFNNVLILFFCLFDSLKLFDLKNLILLFVIGLWEVEIIIFNFVFILCVKYVIFGVEIIFNCIIFVLIEIKLVINVDFNILFEILVLWFISICGCFLFLLCVRI